MHRFMSVSSRASQRFLSTIASLCAPMLRTPTLRTPMLRTPMLGSLLLFSAAACDRAPSTPTSTSHGGVLVISAFADADILMPPLTMTGQGLQVVDAIFDRLAQPTLAADGTTSFAPSLATSWSWTPDSLAIDFTLDAKAKWHDGQPVTAQDVRFTWVAYTDSTLGSPTADALRNIDSVQVRDARKVRVWFKKRSADQLADATTQMRVLPMHLLDSVPRATWKSATFSRQPVGSGRFRFGSWQAGSRLEIVADSGNYRGRPGLDKVVWTVAPDPAAATLRLFSGDADFLESVRPDAAAEFGKHPNVQLLRSPSLAYGFVQFNLVTQRGAPHPLFGNRGLRRALSAAIDRALVVRSVFDSAARVALGPVTRAQLGRDSVLPSLAFDTTQAMRALDSLGWRAGTTGAVRTRNGEPLKFAVLVPSSSSQRLRVAVLLQQLYRAVGVQMDIEKVEFNALNARLAKGDFDAAIMAIGADPQLAGIRGVWGSAASRAKGGVNFGAYANTRFDALLDSAQMQVSDAQARPYYLAAYREILDDAPALWLYEPWNLSGVATRVHPVGLRPDGWWTQLGDWTRKPAKN
jgi:peptide/nickel transport system substrate-binding protein